MRPAFSSCTVLRYRYVLYALHYIHDMCWHDIILHHSTSHHTTSHYITWYYIILHDITSHHITITLHYIASHHIPSHHITSHCISLSHTCTCIRTCTATRKPTRKRLCLLGCVLLVDASGCLCVCVCVCVCVYVIMDGLCGMLLHAHTHVCICTCIHRYESYTGISIYTRMGCNQIRTLSNRRALHEVGTLAKPQQMFIHVITKAIVKLKNVGMLPEYRTQRLITCHESNFQHDTQIYVMLNK